MISRASPTDGEAGVGMEERVGQSGDGGRRDAGLLGHLGCRVARKCCCPVFAIRSLVMSFRDNVVRQAQG